MDQRKKEIEKQAIEFIVNEGIKFLPVSAHKLAEQKKYHLHSYQQIVHLVEKIDYSYDDLVDVYGHAFAFYNHTHGIYQIFYNEKCNTKDRNWSILHEMAHIEQKHWKILELEPIKFREKLEEEDAELFVHTVLCPDPILSELNINNTNQLEKICFIPKSKAEEKTKLLEKRKITNFLFGNKSKDQELILKNKFRSYIDLFKSSQKQEHGEELFPYTEIELIKKRVKSLQAF